jgi:dTDP-glucose 4,6-dehydratase
MSKKVLLTGVGGFVGHHCLEYFLEHTDWTFICLDSFRHKGTCRRVIEVFDNNPRVKIFQHDLTVPIDRQLKNLIEEVRLFTEEEYLEYGVTTANYFKPVDIIINIASESAVERSAKDPVSCCKNNHDLMCNMLEFARSISKTLKSFIHISTDEVYGEAGKDAHKEWATIMPSNPYAASKAAQEALCIAYWRTYDLPISIVNIMNMIGERQDPEKFLPKIIEKVVKGEEVPIYADSEKSIGSRIYLHAKNMADALVFLAQKTPTKYSDLVANGQTADARLDRYNICGDTELNNLELAQLVAEIMGKELKYRLISSESARPGYDRRYALDGNKIKEAGWIAPMTFRESLEKIVNWTLKNPHWIF